MRVPVSWLRDYVPVETPIQDLADRLVISTCEVDGIETAKRLRKRSPETRVILVTGLDDPHVAERANEAGAAALLKKGALHDQLKEAILEAATSSDVTAN